MQKESKELLPSQRHSTREKHPPSMDDLGYTNKEQLKRAGKGAIEAFKKCEKVIALLKKHPHSGIFLYPVTFPGYTDIIKEPMDISTVEKKLKSELYTSTAMFAADVRKIWNNAWTYNQPGSDIYIATTDISNYFEELMRDVKETQFAPGANEEKIQQLKKEVNKANETLRKITSSGAGNLPLQRTSSTTYRKSVDRPMTPKEMANLARNIQKLNSESPAEILRILTTILDLPKTKNTVEFDLQKLPTRKCRKLDQSVKQALAANEKSKSKKKKIDPTLISDIKESQRSPVALPMATTASIQHSTPEENANKEEKKEENLSNLLNNYNRL